MLGTDAGYPDRAADSLGPATMWRMPGGQQAEAPGGQKEGAEIAEADEPGGAEDDEAEEAFLEVDDINVVASFDRATWEPGSSRFGLLGLLRGREGMLAKGPIEKPENIRTLKFLCIPGFGGEDAPEDKKAESQRPRGGAGNSQKKNKGGGKGKEQARRGQRFVPEMGKTELMPGYQKGQWWRNSSENELDVVVREGFSLLSQEIFKVPFGHYVQQAGPAEVFVSGQATGLTRMPVNPRGWATMDATAVGGPRYLEQCKVPRWQVSFRSDTPKGDILVRKDVSLDSEEVGCIFHGALVTQSGPQETFEDGIIRMPITWNEPSSGSGAYPHNSIAGASVARQGWVTCDASSQGGPKFFTAAPAEADQRTAAAPSNAPAPDRTAADAEGSRRTNGSSSYNSWDKNRLWRVTGLEPSANRSLPVTTKSEPYAPGAGRVPPEDSVVLWLSNGDLVEQIGHSKKMRGYMVMPVRLANSPNSDDKEAKTGWVTRRLVDKSRESAEWLVEVLDDESERDRRRAARRERAEKAG